MGAPIIDPTTTKSVTTHPTGTKLGTQISVCCTHAANETDPSRHSEEMILQILIYVVKVLSSDIRPALLGIIQHIIDDIYDDDDMPSLTSDTFASDVDHIRLICNTTTRGGGAHSYIYFPVCSERAVST